MNLVYKIFHMKAIHVEPGYFICFIPQKPMAAMRMNNPFNRKMVDP
jgi:hypothetical protein